METKKNSKILKRVFALVEVQKVVIEIVLLEEFVSGNFLFWEKFVLI